MIEKRILESCLFLDIETVTQKSDFRILEEESPRLALLWSRRAKYYRSTYEEMRDLDDAQIYLEKASLEPEFCKIICVSFGVIHEGSVRINSFYDENEEEILKKCFKVISNANLKNLRLTGHNIKGFDVPCLGKRILYTLGPEYLPSNLMVWNKKPWEINYLDTSEIFSFGSWSQQRYLSLDLLSCSLGIDSPKDQIDGSKVNLHYWSGNPIEEIASYCERDVKTVIEILQRVSF
jgi:hypothetical protein